MTPPIDKTGASAPAAEPAPEVDRFAPPPEHRFAPSSSGPIQRPNAAFALADIPWRFVIPIVLVVGVIGGGKLIVKRQEEQEKAAKAAAARALEEERSRHKGFTDAVKAKLDEAMKTSRRVEQPSVAGKIIVLDGGGVSGALLIPPELRATKPEEVETIVLIGGYAERVKDMNSGQVFDTNVLGITVVNIPDGTHGEKGFASDSAGSGYGSALVWLLALPRR